MNYSHIQSGKNKAFPEKINLWKLGEDIPEWLSDISKVEFVDGSGNITLKTLETNEGGLEIISADGISSIVRMSGKNDYVAIGDNGKIISLTEKQLSLLYRPVPV